MAAEISPDPEPVERYGPDVDASAAPRIVLGAWLASAATLGAALTFLDLAETPFLLASLGGSCVILFGMPDSPMAQPRSLAGGHLVGTLTGLVFLHLFGGGVPVMAGALATALALMLLTDTIHSPAGADPLIVIAAQPGWSFLVAPVGLGVAVLLAGALLYHRFWLRRHYPVRWL
jgi:CBS-domain-containing membrane protein